MKYLIQFNFFSFILNNIKIIFIKNLIYIYKYIYKLNFINTSI